MTTPSEPALTSPFRLQYAYKRSLGPVIGAFMTGLRDGRILGATTDDGRVIVPAREYDPLTGRATGELVEVRPEGTVVTWCGMASSSAEVQRAFAMVRLDGSDSSWLVVVEAAPESLRIGLRVRPRWRAERVGHILDIEAFVPLELGEVVEAPTPSASDQPPVTRFKGPTSLDYTVTASQITAEFLRSILEQRLVGRRCGVCQKVYLPPRGVCPTCVERTHETVEVGQSGVIETFSVVRIPFEGQVLSPPYVCARIELDGVDVPLLHIVGEVDPDLVEVGMRVEAVWDPEPKPTLARVRYFRPVGGTGEQA